jgi:hypothetical protein
MISNKAEKFIEKTKEKQRKQLKSIVGVRGIKK